MESLYLIVPVSIVVFVLAVVLFMWSVDDGQYDDLEGEGGRILYDEDRDVMEASNDEPDASERVRDDDEEANS